ncbi:hypothetical protein WISP_149402 [Willisornis vidua]|uniref:Uncharacterized protein n=1 Tax=Willisornis vidua TaxID=1566151 RepID=A0ABQ9CQB0_9PASS|nr:hypothetical protein WISP_149402 [Willisornis vidua]
MVRQAITLQPMEVHSGANVHRGADILWRSPHCSRGMPEGDCDPLGSLCWNRLLEGPVASWREEPMLEQVCWPCRVTPLGQSVLEGLNSLEGTALEQSVMNCCLWGGHVVEVHEGLSPVGETPQQSWERV